MFVLTSLKHQQITRYIQSVYRHKPCNTDFWRDEVAGGNLWTVRKVRKQSSCQLSSENSLQYYTHFVLGYWLKNLVLCNPWQAVLSITADSSERGQSGILRTDPQQQEKADWEEMGTSEENTTLWGQHRPNQSTPNSLPEPGSIAAP